MFTIPEFFEKKNIFVTGGSGFIGKVLIEKLLRSCPDIGNIYVLLREKIGKTSRERIQDMTNIPLFEPLKKQNGDAINKLIPLNGDIGELNLDNSITKLTINDAVGLSDEDRNTIIDQVSIVFHVAASVRFDNPLKKAIHLNVRGTVEVIGLVKDLKNCAAFAHVSTAYSNCDNKIIEEKLYPARVDWRDAIRLAEEMDPHVLEIFTKKYIKPHPNTYTFTKTLAEQVVNDLCDGEIPAIIFRPTIVAPTIKEPIIAWVDNFNGPFAFGAGAATGLLRTFYSEKEGQLDHVFVDTFVKSVIIATWDKALDRVKNYDVPIYNCCSELVYSSSMYNTMGAEIGNKVKLENKIWNPVSARHLTKCYYYYFINVILFHMIPAMLLDGLLRVCKKKPFVAKLHRKIYHANMSLYYFSDNSWEFKRNNYLGLQAKLLKDDLKSFSFGLPKDINTTEGVLMIFEQAMLGVKEYLLNEEKVVTRKAELKHKCFSILDKSLKLAAQAFILYTLFWKYDMLTYILESLYNHFAKL